MPSAQGVLGWPCAVWEAEGVLQGATWLLGKHEHRCGKTQDVVLLVKN